MSDFIDKLNARSKNIKWDSVGNVIRHYVETDEVKNITNDDIDLSGLAFYGYKENFRIFLRRYISEFRDNYLSKNDFLLKCAKSIVNLTSK